MSDIVQNFQENGPGVYQKCNGILESTRKIRVTTEKRRNLGNCERMVWGSSRRVIESRKGTEESGRL